MTILRRLLGGGDRQAERARRPEALAASRSGNGQEGLDWLGRPPSRRAPRLYRILVGLGELFLFGICRIRVETSARDQLPPGGYIAAAALHRGWIDPLVVLRTLPREPRVWFLGSAASVFDRRWKEMLLRRTGGLLPVWRGGGIDVHVQAARAVAEEGAILCLFIEGASARPPGHATHRCPDRRGPPGAQRLDRRAAGHAPSLDLADSTHALTQALRPVCLVLWMRKGQLLACRHRDRQAVAGWRIWTVIGRRVGA